MHKMTQPDPAKSQGQLKAHESKGRAQEPKRMHARTRKATTLHAHPPDNFNKISHTTESNDKERQTTKKGRPKYP